MHGIVYVPESEAPSDPLEVEGQCSVVDAPAMADCDGVVCSTAIVGATVAGQRRAVIHRDAGAHASKYGGEHEREGEVVEHLPTRRVDRRGHLSGLVVEAVL